MAGGLNGMNTSTPGKMSTSPQEAGRIFDASQAHPSSEDFSAFDPALMDMFQPEESAQEFSQSVDVSEPTSRGSLNATEQLGIWKDAPTDTAERFGMNGVTLYDSRQDKTDKRIEKLRSGLPQQPEKAPSNPVDALAEAMQRAQGTRSNVESSERLTEQKYEAQRAQALARIKSEIAAHIQQSELKANVAGRVSAIEMQTNQRTPVADVGTYSLFKMIRDSIINGDKAKAALEIAQRRQSQLSAQKGPQSGLEGGSDRRADSVAAMQERKLAQTVASHEWSGTE